MVISRREKLKKQGATNMMKRITVVITDDDDDDDNDDDNKSMVDLFSQIAFEFYSLEAADAFTNGPPVV